MREGTQLDVAACEHTQAHTIRVPAGGDLIDQRHTRGTKLSVLVNRREHVQRAAQVLHVCAPALQRQPHLVQAQQADGEFEPLPAGVDRRRVASGGKKRRDTAHLPAAA